MFLLIVSHKVHRILSLFLFIYLFPVLPSDWIISNALSSRLLLFSSVCRVCFWSSLLNCSVQLLYFLALEFQGFFFFNVFYFSLFFNFSVFSMHCFNLILLSMCFCSSLNFKRIILNSSTIHRSPFFFNIYYWSFISFLWCCLIYLIVDNSWFLLWLSTYLSKWFDLSDFVGSLWQRLFFTNQLSLGFLRCLLIWFSDRLGLI